MREDLVEMMATYLQSLVDYMCLQASAGDTQFTNNLENRHHLSYLKDIHYLQQNKVTIIAGICEA